jgi:hypothetical protein
MRSLTYAIMTALLLIVGLSCIERNNPFDPVNDTPRGSSLTPRRRDTIRGQTDPALAHLADSARVLAVALNSMRRHLSEDSARIAARLEHNTALKDANDSIIAANRQIQAYNDTVSAVDSLALKAFLDTLDTLAPPDTFPHIDQLRYELSLHRLTAVDLIDSINLRYAPDTIYGPTARESALRPFDSLDALLGDIRARATSLFASVRDTNHQLIAPYNDTVTARNAAIRTYNDSILFAMRYHPYPPITDVDTLQTRLFAAEPGDTLVVAGGTFSPIVRFVNSGTAQRPIVVQGQLDMTTVFVNPDVRLSGNGYILFQHLTFRGNPESGGVKLEANAGPITFRSCRFEDNATFGLEIIDSDARLADCRITGNGGSGMRISSSRSAANRVTLDNVLIAHNRLDGIDVVTSALSIGHTTISDNGRNGIRLSDPEAELAVFSSLVTYNGRHGIHFESGFTAGYPFTIHYSVLYGNTDSPPVTGHFSDSLDYWSFAVSYADQSTNDYAVAAGNRVYELDRQGIIIGYRRDRR